MAGMAGIAGSAGKAGIGAGMTAGKGIGYSASGMGISASGMGILASGIVADVVIIGAGIAPKPAPVRVNMGGIDIGAAAVRAKMVENMILKF